MSLKSQFRKEPPSTLTWDEFADAEIERCKREQERRNGSNGELIRGRVKCDCRECRDSNGKRHRMPMQHDCDYTQKRFGACSFSLRDCDGEGRRLVRRKW